MAKTMGIQKERMATDQMGTTDLDSITRDASQVGMGVMIALAAMIGIWGFACLVGGIANSESLPDLVNGFITAVTGH